MEALVSSRRVEVGLQMRRVAFAEEELEIAPQHLEEAQ